VPDAAVIHDELVRWRNAKPFVPFTIILEDGRRFDVTDTFKMALNDRIVLVVSPQMGTQHFRVSEVVAIKRRDTRR